MPNTVTMPNSGCRDYSLTGPNAKAPLGIAEWYASPAPRKRLKELMKRSDRLALTNYGIWLTLVVATGALLVAVWGTAWAWPTALVYGVFLRLRARIPAGMKPDMAHRSRRAG